MLILFLGFPSLVTHGLNDWKFTIIMAIRVVELSIYYKKRDKITYSHAMLKVRENIIIFITQNDDEHLYKAHIRFKTQ
jgi:hypothetical protein